MRWSWLVSATLCPKAKMGTNREDEDGGDQSDGSSLLARKQSVTKGIALWWIVSIVSQVLLYHKQCRSQYKRFNSAGSGIAEIIVLEISRQVRDIWASLLPTRKVVDGRYQVDIYSRKRK